MGEIAQAAHRVLHRDPDYATELTDWTRRTPAPDGVPATGMVLYTAHPRIPAGDHRLTLTDVRDRALVFGDGAALGVADP